MSTFNIKRNDTSPALSATLTNAAGNPVPLTGASVRFHMGNSAGSTVDADATIVDAAAGQVRYDWIAADTATEGVFNAEFEVTFAGGAIETFPNSGMIQVTVTADVA